MSKRNRTPVAYVAVIALSTLLSLTLIVSLNSGSESAAHDAVNHQTATPPFLKDATWPPAMQVPFVNYGSGTTPSGPNQLDYLFPAPPAGGKNNGRLHSYFRKCPGLPCVPASFLTSGSQTPSLPSGEPLPCQFYMFRNPKQAGRYWAYAYSEALHQYAPIADGLGPMLPDFLSRYYQVNQIAPSSQPPADSVPIGNPPTGSVLWFHVAGFGGSAETEDLFALYDVPTRTAQGSYRPPYSFGGKHGQVVYGVWNLQPVFDTNTFRPPSSGYSQAPAQVVTYKDGDITLPCPMRVPFDLYDHPVVSGEPAQDTIMVCVACHDSDARPKKGSSN
jgi:hypothetical protein